MMRGWQSYATCADPGAVPPTDYVKITIGNCMLELPLAIRDLRPQPIEVAATYVHMRLTRDEPVGVLATLDGTLPVRYEGYREGETLAPGLFLSGPE